MLLQCEIMWKVKLDDDTWLAKGRYGNVTTSRESEAWVLPDVPTARQELKNARRSHPYRNAMIIAAFDELK